MSISDEAKYQKHLFDSVWVNIKALKKDATHITRASFLRMLD